MIEKSNKLLKYIGTLIWVLILVCIDQLIKIIILKNFMYEKYYFIGNFIGYEPILNDKYSYINSLGNLGINLTVHIIVAITILLISALVYIYIKETYRVNPLQELIFIFLFSGAICSLIDKIFWGGSLDYIFIEGFFTFDLKDVYISIFEVLVLGCLVFNFRGLRKFDEKKFIRDLKRFYWR